MVDYHLERAKVFLKKWHFFIGPYRRTSLKQGKGLFAYVIVVFYNDFYEEYKIFAYTG